PVAVPQEEAARLIEQQVVEMAFQLLFFQAQLLLNGANRLLEERLPIGIGQGEVLRRQPPNAPDARIDDGLFALAVGGLLAMFLQLLRLLGGERQSKGP